MIVFAEGPEPAPWWQRVEETQEFLTKWIGTITVVCTAAITAVFTLWALLLSRLKEIRERQDRQSDRMNKAEEKITTVALAATPTATTPVESPNPPNVKLPALALICALSFSSCTTLSPQGKRLLGVAIEGGIAVAGGIIAAHLAKSGDGKRMR